MLSVLLAVSGAGLPAGADAAGLHDGWDALLHTHVRNGRVDYAGLKRDEARLDAYLARLAGTQPGRLGRAERMAFWINGYNAFTVKLILRHYPGIRSIKDIPRRWDLEDWRVGGRLYSLTQIEHGILRTMGDPRIHFAIVCASKSCPDLASEAYRASRLEAQLTAAARTFFADRAKGLSTGETRGWLGNGKPTMFVSSILQWFAEDFELAAGSVPYFAARYAPPEARDFILAHRRELTVEYLPYDWTLNG